MSAKPRARRRDKRAPQKLPVPLDHRRVTVEQRPQRPLRSPAKPRTRSCARQPRTMGLAVGAQPSGEPLTGDRQPLAPSAAHDGLGTLAPLGQRRDKLTATREPSAEELWPQPCGDARELILMNLRIGAERARQPRRRMVEPLARQREQVLRPRQRAGGGAKLGAARLLGALP